MMSEQKYQLIGDLCESRLFRSKQAAQSYSSTDKNEVLMAVLLSTLGLALDTKTSTWARDYAGQTAAFGNFDHFRPSATDLYVLLYLAQGQIPAVQSRQMLSLLKGLSKGYTDQSTAQQLLLRLENILRITDTRLRNARRVITNWGSESTASRRAALNQLMQYLRAKARKAEVIPYIKVLTKGEPGSFGVASTLKKAAALAGAGLAGLALGYTLHDPNRKFRLLSPLKNSVDRDDDALNEDRATHLFDIVRKLTELPIVDKVVSTNYLSNGISALVRTTDGNAYEFEIRPAKYAKGHQDKTGVKESMTEGSEKWFWRVELCERNHHATIALTPDDLRTPDGDGLIVRQDSDKDVMKNLKKVAELYDVEFVEDFAEYTKPNSIKESTHNQYNHKAQWLEHARRKGYDIDEGGDNKLYAHIDGNETGVWDPTYGGAGYGWFYD